MKIHTAVLIGSGNVAHHLGPALKQAGVNILAVYSPTQPHAKQLADKLHASAVDRIENLPAADFVLIAVGDNQIADVSRQIPDRFGLIAHTSGSTPMSDLSHSKAMCAVLYPFQTFSKNRDTILSDIPFFLECTELEGLNALQDLVGRISNKVFVMDSAQRKKLHLTGVLANNFTNHLIHLATDWLEKENIPQEVLYPLLEETVKKALATGPGPAQTGPALRGDENTIQEHLELLNNQPDLKELYSVFTESIKRRNHGGIN